MYFDNEYFKIVLETSFIYIFCIQRCTQWLARICEACLTVQLQWSLIIAGMLGQPGIEHSSNRRRFFDKPRPTDDVCVFCVTGFAVGSTVLLASDTAPTTHQLLSLYKQKQYPGIGAVRLDSPTPYNVARAEAFQLFKGFFSVLKAVLIPRSIHVLFTRWNDNNRVQLNSFSIAC